MFHPSSDNRLACAPPSAPGAIFRRQIPTLGKAMVACQQMGVRACLPWSLSVFFTLVLVMCTIKPSHLLDDQGRFKRMGVSDQRDTSILAAPTIAFVLATSAIFFPLVASMSRFSVPMECVPNASGYSASAPAPRSAWPYRP